ncbi:MAG: ABC transporter substrate-binding protein [Candidatus Dadabacteria bacterium]|nr:ABC transporter substrate-binding protein [Candidatus Dadabacteria bacterium]NIQ15008.1 ABC transporter substrate-binding protein [Candidatus Dadabacteria bacterium]
MRLGHSPDADDAFMFYAIAKNKVNSDKVDFIHVIEEIQSLNKRAMNAELEVTAISAHGYLKVQDKYRILSCGASMGEGYGPIVVSKNKIDTLEGKKIAVPGKLTTAYLLLQIYYDDFIPVEVAFDDIIDEVLNGNVDAGLLIHEGQLTYKDFGLELFSDIGVLWAEETPLPMPLGLNVLRRDIPEGLDKEVLRVHKESIEYGLENKKEALEYAMEFGRGMEEDIGEKFVLMYVNEYTRDLGTKGLESLKLLFDKAYDKGIISDKAKLDILYI